MLLKLASYSISDWRFDNDSSSFDVDASFADFLMLMVALAARSNVGAPYFW